MGVILFSLLFFVVTAFMIYNLLWEYKIYSVKKKLYRMRTVDEVSLFVRRFVKKSFLEKIDGKLKEAGYPFNLTPETYILARIGLALFSAAYIYLTRMTGLQAGLMLAIGFFGLDFYINSAKKSRLEKFRRNMPEIVDIFELGAAADVPLEEIFLIVSQTAQEKEIKDALTRLAADYIVSREKRGCLDRFCKEVDLPEAHVLAMALLQAKEQEKRWTYFQPCRRRFSTLQRQNLQGRINQWNTKCLLQHFS